MKEHLKKLVLQSIKDYFSPLTKTYKFLVRKWKERNA